MIYGRLLDAIVVMAKRPGRGEGPRELEARAALAALFWRREGRTIPMICVEGYDLPDTTDSGAEIVRQVALTAGVPNAAIVARPQTNCTVREVRAIREILQERGASQPLVITHPYHVRRTRGYLREAGVEANVVGCSSALVRGMFAGADEPLRGLVERGETSRLNLLREYAVEFLLTILHAVDRQGRVEMFLADRVRGRGEKPVRKEANE